MRRFLARMAAFARRGRAEREMAREMAAHLALMEEDFRRRGMDEREAHFAALRAWGGVEQAKEMHREARSFTVLEQWLQDARHAVRSLRQSPGFTAVALVSLACGIGVNTAIFTLVNGILLKRLPVAEPERVVQVVAHLPQFESTVFSYPGFRELRRQTGIFSSLAAFNANAPLVDFGAGEEQVELAMVTGSYFGFMGAGPALGRLIGEEDDLVEGASPVCVISYRTWQARFGGTPDVIHRTLRVSGVPLQIVGVAPRGFVDADITREDEVWAPTALFGLVGPAPRESGSYFWLRILGRLRPGLSFAEAQARLKAASPQIEAGLPRDRGNRGAWYRLTEGSRGFDSWRNTFREPLLMLMGAVTLVLLVACANLANLLLARSGERRQEFAIKLSLGISRARLLRQLLLETLAVAGAGGALAWVLGIAVTGYLLRTMNEANPYRRLHVAPDSTVALYTSAACLLTALMAGLYPAWQAARTDVAPRLAPVGVARRGILRRGLIVVQVTLAVVLLFGASLFAHSLHKLRTVDLGYDIENVLSVPLGPAMGRHLRPSVAPPGMMAALERVRGLPGVEAAALSYPGLLSGNMASYDLRLRDAAGVEHKIENVYEMKAGAGFFSTLRMPLLKGRDFGPQDRAGAPIAVVVNERLASLAWPGEDPVGRHMPISFTKDAVVVGVVGNSKYLDVREQARPIVYEAFEQGRVLSAMLEIRGHGDLGRLASDVRRIVKSTAPEYEVRNPAPLAVLRDTNISQDRILALLSSLFGALGTALAMVGIYGLIAYSVARRTREVGIRMSVGARRGDVLWLFLRESLALAAAGMAVGLPLALVLARFAGKMLYGVSTSEPADLAITLALLAAGSAAAAYLPGRRAARIDPVEALRHE